MAKKYFKKGVGLGLTLGIGILLVTLFVFTSVPAKVADQKLGESQYNMLSLNQEMNFPKLYIQKSLERSAKEAKLSFILNGGVFNHQNDCGIRIYPILMNSNTLCLQDVEGEFSSFVKKYFSEYITKYKSMNLNTNYIIKSKYIEDKNTPYVDISLNVPLNTRFIIKEDFSSMEQSLSVSNYPVDEVFGTCNNEKIFECTTNKCVVDSTLRLYNLYSNLNLPYVSGGESPYTYRDSKYGDCKDYFDVTQISLKEVGKDRYTRPGFDCSGWVWWVLSHAGLEDFSKRETAHKYYLKAQDDLVWDIYKTRQILTKDSLNNYVAPGDVLFLKEKKQVLNPEVNVSHIVIYVGNNEIVHANPVTNLAKEKMPSGYYPMVVGAARYFDESGEDENYFPLITKNEQISSSDVCLNFDSNQIVANNIRPDSRDMSYADFERELNQYPEVLIAISKAHLKFPDVPEELIKGIIFREVGGKTNIGTKENPNWVSYFSLYMNGDRTCNPGCGIMQVESAACQDINQRIGQIYDKNYFNCDWNALQNRKNTNINGEISSFLEHSIEVGTAYLDIINKRNVYRYITKTDYFFWSLCYNRGTGNFRKIIQETMKRTGKFGQDLVWKDVIYDDLINAGLNERDSNIGLSYPNIVGLALKEQCGGVETTSYPLSSVGYSDYADESNSGTMTISQANDFIHNSYVALSPSAHTFLQFNLSHMNNINKFVQIIFQNQNEKNLIETLTDAVLLGQSYTPKINLISFLDVPPVYSKKMTYNQYSQVPPDIVFKNLVNSLKDKEILRDLILDQMFDCYENEQFNCICPIKIPHTTDLWKVGFNSISFEIIQNADGVYIAQPTNYEYKVERSKKLNSYKSDVVVPFNPFIQQNSSEQIRGANSLLFKLDSFLDVTSNPYVWKNKFTMLFKQQGTFNNPISGSDPFGTKSWSWNVTPEQEISLYKNMNGELSWYMYNSSNPNNPMLCIPTKNKFTFQSSLLEQGLSSDFEDAFYSKFTVEIKDKFPPEIKINQTDLEIVQLKNCLGSTPTVLASWIVEEFDEPLALFNLYLVKENKLTNFIPIYMYNPIIKNYEGEATQNIKTNVLYFDPSSSRYFYATKITPDGPLTSGKYTFAVTATDIYKNVKYLDEKTPFKEFEIKEIKTQEELLNQYLISNPESPALDPNSLNDLLCELTITDAFAQNILNYFNQNGLVCCEQYVPSLKMDEIKFKNEN